jgi:guanylate kinase
VKRLMLTITGASCSGKGYLLEKLIESGKFAGIKSYTTRARRPGEGDSEYKFVSQRAFASMRHAGEFVQFVDFNGTHYGTSRADLLNAFGSGKIPVRVVEPSGVMQFEEAVRGLDCNVMSVFVYAYPEVLMERWMERIVATPNPDIKHFASRLTTAMQEETHWGKSRGYDVRVISNTPEQGRKAFDKVFDAATAWQEGNEGLVAKLSRLLTR